MLPIVFTVIVGGGLAGGSSRDSRLPVLVVDGDQSRSSGYLVSALQESGVVRVSTVTEAAAAESYDKRQAAVWLTIPPGFGAALLAGQDATLAVRSQPNSLDAAAINSAIRTAASQVSRPVSAARLAVTAAEQRRAFTTPAARAAYLEESLAFAQEMAAAKTGRLDVTQPAASQAQAIDMPSQGSAGQLITWVFIPLLATSALFAYERSQGTLRRLLTTPTSKATYLLGTLTGQLLLALLQMVLLVTFGIVVMHLQWGKSPAALALMLVTFGLASVALGTTLGTFVKTEGQATGLSIMAGMLMALLGGCWYPIELFPDIARTASKLLPTAWAMQGLTDLVSRGQGLSGILTEASVLAGFAAVFLVVGIWRFRYE